MKRKTKIAIGVSLAVGLGLYILLRRPKYPFIDNVWCEDDTCSNIEPVLEGNKVVDYVNTAAEGRSARGYEDNTGWVNLLFEKEHNLDPGDDLYIKQDDNAVYPYDGKRIVQKVLNPYVVQLNVERKGSDEGVGGDAYKNSMLTELVGA